MALTFATKLVLLLLAEVEQVESTGAPKATLDNENTDNATSATTRGAQLFRIANNSALKRERNQE